MHVHVSKGIVNGELWMNVLGRVTRVLYFILQRSTSNVVAFGVKCLANVHPQQVSQVCHSVSREWEGESTVIQQVNQ